MKQGDEILRFEKTVQNIGTLTEDDAPRAFALHIHQCKQSAGCHHPRKDNLRLYGGRCLYRKSTSGRNANHHADLPPEKSSWNDRYEHFRLSIFFG